jgi:uncharacterized lipoprotein YajG
MPRRPFAVFLALVSLLLLAGCNAPPTRQRGTAYPAPPDVGPSVEPRHVNFTHGDTTHTYTLDTCNLGQVLNHLPDNFFDVEESALE